MRIGVHCSVRNGFAEAIREASRLGCEAMQMFSRSPRMWRTRTHDREEFLKFREAREETGIYPVAVHSPYLPNLCTSRDQLYDLSCRVLKEDLKICGDLGVEYLVIHPGAYSPEESLEAGLSQLARALRQALQEVNNSTVVLIENMAGGGRRVGARFEEIRSGMGRLDGNPTLGACLETCHALGAGYEVNSNEGVERVLKEFKRHLDVGLVRMFHVNDSKAPLGSHRDRHEHLGKGYVGERAFRALLCRPEFRSVAAILETPKDSPEADPQNLRVLRGYLKQR